MGPRYAPDVKIIGVAAIAPAANPTDILERNPAADKRLGPYVALAYSRFDDATREAVHGEYIDSIAAYRAGEGYRIPGEFLVAAARAPS